MQSEQKICGNVNKSETTHVAKCIYLHFITRRSNGFCEMMDFTGKIPTGGISKRCNIISNKV